MTHTARAQSAVLGTVLVTVITVVAVTALLAAAGPAIEAAADDSRCAAVKTELAQINADSRRAALWAPATAHTDFDIPGGGVTRFDPAAGRVRLTVNAPDTSAERVYAATLGTLSYEADDCAVAVQAGGVWTRDQAGGDVLLTPPLTRREATLSVPLVRLRGDGEQTRVRRHATVQSDRGAIRAIRPNTTRHLQPGTVVTLAVESAYYEAWGAYFDEQLGGTVSVDTATQTAAVRFVVPPTVPLEAPLSVAATRSETTVPLAPTTYDAGVSQPPVAELTDSWIARAAENGRPLAACLEATVCSSGLYYADDESRIREAVRFAPTDGDVTLVVDGDLTVDGATLQLATTATATGGVRYVVRGDLTVDGATIGTAAPTIDASRTRLYVTGETVTVTSEAGSTRVDAVVYAPAAKAIARGDIGLQGALAVARADIGHSVRLRYDPALAGTRLRLGVPRATALTRLHASEHTLTLRLG